MHLLRPQIAACGDRDRLETDRRLPEKTASRI
jgi:hypothetical protein